MSDAVRSLLIDRDDPVGLKPEIDSLSAMPFRTSVAAAMRITSDTVTWLVRACS